VVTARHAGVEAAAANVDQTRHAVSFVFPLPLAYRDALAQARRKSREMQVGSPASYDKNPFSRVWRWTDTF